MLLGDTPFLFSAYLRSLPLNEHLPFFHALKEAKEKLYFIHSFLAHSFRTTEEEKTLIGKMATTRRRQKFSSSCHYQTTSRPHNNEFILLFFFGKLPWRFRKLEGKSLQQQQQQPKKKLFPSLIHCFSIFLPASVVCLEWKNWKLTFSVSWMDTRWESYSYKIIIIFFQRKEKQDAII